MDPTRPFRPDAQHKGYPPLYGPPMMGPYPPPPMMPYPPHYQLPMHGPPGAYGMHPPPFPPGVPPYPGPPPVMQPAQPEQPIARPPSPPNDGATKGTDPHGHDMSSAKALARAFGVSDMITSGLKLDPVTTEDMPVNPNAKYEVATPRDASHWVTVSLRRDQSAGGGPNTLSLYGPVSISTQVEVWLPKDRKFSKHIIDGYFARLNIHRPVYARKDFDKVLNDLYEGVTYAYDPGHLCCIFLIFALGTLSELNNLAVKANLDADQHQGLGSSVAKKLMPHDWPSHDEFFERALLIEPDLEVSITSLQALILLHWYLYIQVCGNTLLLLLKKFNLFWIAPIPKYVAPCWYPYPAFSRTRFAPRPDDASRFGEPSASFHR